MGEGEGGTNKRGGRKVEGREGGREKRKEEKRSNNTMLYICKPSTT